MVVDHVGVILFPDVYALRVIGRLCYPLFAFLIAYGCTKTRDMSRYFLRLICFAVWLQIAWAAYAMLFDTSAVPQQGNILFTLAFGVLAIWVANYFWKGAPAKTVIDRLFLTFISGAMAALVCALGYYLGVDYGAPGVAAIVLFYAMLKARPFITNKTFAFTFHILAPAAILVLCNGIDVLISGNPIQGWAPLAVVFIWFFADRRLRITWFEKYFFYLFYPLHMIILYGIAWLL